MLLGAVAGAASLSREAQFFANTAGAGMFVNGVNVPTVNYVYGIGGRDTTATQIESVYNDLAEIVKTGKVENPYRYLGLRKEEK